MNRDKLNIKEAIKYLKASYQLYAIIDKKEERFLFLNNSFIIKNDQKNIKLNEYEFSNLYKDTYFYLIENENEETVDIKKDEEYYSWRQ